MSTPFGAIPDGLELPKVFIYCAGTYGPEVEALPHDYLMIAVSEDGEGLGSHICSHPSFALGDLHNQRARHEAYHQKFGGWGDGRYYRIVQVPVGESPPDEVMAAIREKNEEAAAEGGEVDG